MYIKFPLEKFNGKVPDYMGSLVGFISDQPSRMLENTKIFANSIGASVQYHAGEWKLVARTSETAETAMRVILDIPDDCDIYHIKEEVLSIYYTAIESGFSTKDYSIFIEDSERFIIAKKDLLVILKLTKE